MSSLLDLFKVNANALRQTPQRMWNLPQPEPAPEWDVRSGLPEPGLDQVTPEEWLPPGAGMKLAALAKGLTGKSALSGIFIGPKHYMWNSGAAQLAAKMKANGVDPRSIWKTTGTFTELPDGLRQEISDAGSGVNVLNMRNPILSKPGYYINKKFSAPAKEMYDHPKLFSGYPDLAKGPMNLVQGMKQSGEYVDSTGAIEASAPTLKELSSIALHELQHGVQNAEGWTRGGSAQGVMNDPNLLPYWTKEVMGIIHSNPQLHPDDAEHEAAYNIYKRLQGEAEARATQARASLRGYERRMNYPGDSYDVPIKDLLVPGNQDIKSGDRFRRSK